MNGKNEWMNIRMDSSLEFVRQLSREKQTQMLSMVQPFMTLLMQYRCAIREMETKLNVLNEEFSLRYERNPIESIESRVKDMSSILEKMERKGYELSVENIEARLNDVAGIRVICSFVEDIYYLADMLSAQDDLEVLKIKDYIKRPKANGYRSLHLIIQIPIFLSDQKRYMKVEVQFRTIAMDFWASLDHQLKYKKELVDGTDISRELKDCADVIAQTDEKMLDIRKRIEAQGVVVMD